MSVSEPSDETVMVGPPDERAESPRRERAFRGRPRSPLSVRAVLHEAWTAYASDPGTCVSMTVLNLSIGFVGGIAVTIVSQAVVGGPAPREEDFAAIQVMQAVLGTFPEAVAALIFSRAMLGVLRGGRAARLENGELVSMFPSMALDIGIVKFAALVLLIGPMIGLVMCVMRFGQGAAFGGLLLLLLAFWNFLMIAATSYLTAFTIADPAIRCRGFAAIARTWTLSRGYRTRLVRLMFASFAVGVSGFLFLGVGALVSLPVAHLMWASAYNRLVIADGERMLAESAADGGEPSA